MKRVKGIQMSTMNILVIGNGFDLAHGLPTRYMDFLEFIEEYFIYKEKGESQKQCSLYFKKVEELKEYYKQRGYKTEISDNVLSVTSLRTYPEKSSSDKTLGVKIKYLNEKELQFVGFIEEYDF